MRLRRAVLGVLWVASAGLVPSVAVSVGAPAAGAAGPSLGTAEALRPSASDLSAPLRDAPTARAASAGGSGAIGETFLGAIGPAPAGPAGSPQKLQAAPSSSQKFAAIPGPLVSFDGIGQQDMFNITGGGLLPPDPNGEVGPNHYVEMINSLVTVFSKTGVQAAGFPKQISALWSGLGGNCATRNDGDPVVVYDQLADRWVITQFAVPSAPNGPTTECIAVSQTGDPTGAYFRYSFGISAAFNDYPKFGVWPDGYYMSTNDFNPSGASAVVFDRVAMLAGNPAAGGVRFNLPSSLRGLLPADLDGMTTPSVGAPNPFTRIASTSSLEVFRFHADFVTLANNTFTSAGTVTTAAFDQSFSCGAFPFRDCLAQPGTTEKLDAIADRLLFRAAYRNFGDHEALVVNHTIDVGTDHAGVFWHELRSLTSGAPTLFQEGTQAPDADNRWMASVAQDGSGNMAVGYSVGSATTFPSIRYAGRNATDPLGTLPLTETTLQVGAGSQTSTSSRWGDYTDMTVDPVDDCTFWYVNEYYSSTSSGTYRTRIGAFRIAGCVPPISICAAPPPPGPGDVVLVGAGATYTATNPAGERIYGTAGQDQIAGGPGNDVIFGGPGNDALSGGGGDDVICGGDGNDRLGGGNGNDRLSGDAGNDALFGDAGNDALYGGLGFDRLDGGAGTNTNDGGPSNDFCVNGTNTNCP